MLKAAQVSEEVPMPSPGAQVWKRGHARGWRQGLGFSNGGALPDGETLSSLPGVEEGLSWSHWKEQLGLMGRAGHRGTPNSPFHCLPPFLSSLPLPTAGPGWGCEHAGC